MAKNDKQWSSATPGLLIILLDQSGSMLSAYEGTTRTAFASLAVNKVIDNIIQKNFDGDAPKNRCFISVIGYNHNVKELCSGWLKELDENPLRYETLKKKTPDGAGGICEVEVKQPVWVEPITQDGATNMLGALQLAKDLAGKWITDNPDGPAPVIINISDGVPFYDGKDPRDCMKETVLLAKEIMSMSTKRSSGSSFRTRLPASPAGASHGRPPYGNRQNNRSPRPHPAAGCGYRPGWERKPGRTAAPSPWAGCPPFCRPPSARKRPYR